MVDDRDSDEEVQTGGMAGTEAKNSPRKHNIQSNEVNKRDLKNQELQRDSILAAAQKIQQSKSFQKCDRSPRDQIDMNVNSGSETK